MKGFTIDGLGDPIRVVEGDASGGLGYWDPGTGTIVIDKEQPEPGKHVVLLHELMHLTETMLLQSGLIKTEVDHGWITMMAPNLLLLLVKSGMYTGVPEAELVEWMSESLPGPGESAE